MVAVWKYGHEENKFVVNLTDKEVGVLSQNPDVTIEERLKWILIGGIAGSECSSLKEVFEKTLEIYEEYQNGRESRQVRPTEEKTEAKKRGNEKRAAEGGAAPDGRA